MTGLHESLAAFSQWIWPLMARHLVETTAFAVLVGLAVVAFRKAGAAARYTAWLLVAAKFALPAAMLAAVGLRAGALFPHAAAQTTWMPAFPTLWRPYPAASTLLEASRHNELFCVLTAIWLTGTAVLLAAWFRRLLPVKLTPVRPPNDTEREALGRAAKRVGCRTPIELVITHPESAPFTAGVLGPRIAVPDGISASMEPSELEAMLMHEAGHVRRRDNLVAHGVRAVCSLFWFYPLLWWLERSILFERERACDEMVVGSGAPPDQYASAILKTCCFSVTGAANVSCAAGSNLKRRMEQIMSHAAISPRCSHACRAVVGALAVALFTVPLAAGFLGQTDQTQPGKQRGGIEFVSVKLIPGTGKTSEHKDLMKAIAEVVNPLASSPQPSGDRYQKWLQEEVLYLSTPEEKETFLTLNTDTQRDQFIEQFWKRRDPTPGTEINEFKDEHYRRIKYANERFAKDVPGWQTDRGRIYIVMGPPDEIETDGQKFETWKYSNVDDSTDTIVIGFSTR